MASISIFGETFAPEFFGEFEDAAVTENVALSSRTKAIQKARQDLPAEVGWTFSSTGGKRGIFVQYSSAGEMPCDLIVNGMTVQQKALFESTHGLKLVDWRYQCSLDLEPGETNISIRSTGPLPHIRALAVGPVPSEPQASVDAYFERLSAERTKEDPAKPLKLRPCNFSGLANVASSLASDDAAIRKLATIAGLAVTASQQHVLNGQAAIPWGGPLNGQRYRQYVMERLMRLGVDAIVETGTFLGTSTAFFARHGMPVRSCELRDEFFASALAQLTAFENITLYLMDSRAFLREVANDPSLDYKRPFFYLDAHWYDDLPLSDEIRIIQERWAEYFIMVDDFCVPETQYNFDRYPNGLELTLEHLEKEGIDLSETAVLFPSAAPTAETSARRGTLILTPIRLYEEHLRGERAMFRYVAKR